MCSRSTRSRRQAMPLPSPSRSRAPTRRLRDRSSRPNRPGTGLTRIGRGGGSPPLDASQLARNRTSPEVAVKAQDTPKLFGSLLVVDDSAVQRAHTVELCRDLGVPMIYEATSGAEALELLAMLVLPPELMIVDLEMPGMDGVELIQQLRARRFIVPLIVASGRETSLIQSVETMAR